MKTKKNRKKLTLNKISIANLDKDKIHEAKAGLPLIKGGILPGSWTTCKTKNPPCPCGLDYCDINIDCNICPLCTGVTFCTGCC
jgi:hypothetical protein